MKNKFLSGALILIIFNLLGKVIGAVYRIPLAGILGGEGMGQYQLTFPLYCLVLTVATSGIPVAISKIVAEMRAKEEFASSKKLLKISLLILTGLSAILSVIVVLAAKFISKLQGNPEIYICYYAIAPAVLFVGILSAFRGYFQGNMLMAPTAISSLIEQVVKLFVGLFFAQKFVGFSTQYGVFGAVLGISISEIVAFLYLFVTYLFSAKKLNIKSQTKPLPARELSKRLLSVAGPITLGGMVAPLTALIDSLLVVNLLMLGGFSSQTSTMMLGVQSGMVEPLVNIPVIISVSIATVVLPEISSLVASKKSGEISNVISRAFEISLSIAATCFVCFVIFGKQILTFLFGASLGGYELAIALKLLFIGGLNIVFLSLVQVSAGVLQGLEHQKYPVFSLLVGCVVKILLDAFLILIPQINILGAAIAAGGCYVAVFALNYRKIVKLTQTRIKGALGRLMVQQCAICLFAFSLNKLLLPIFGSTTSLFAAGAVTGMIFLVTFYLMFLQQKNLNTLNEKI